MNSARRNFLRTAAAAPLFAGLGLSTTSAAEVSKSGDVKFDLGLASYTTRKFDRAQTIAMCKRAGLKFVCLKDFHLKLTSTDEECAAAAEECKADDLTLYAGGVITMKTREDVDNAFRYAKACGMTTIVGVPFQDVLEHVDKKVKETGIYVAVHNHGPEDKRYPTPQSIMMHIEKLDKRIGLCIDVGHTERAGVNVPDTIRQYKDRLLDFHVKDEASLEGRGKACICGRGLLDIPSYLVALKEVGYDKIVSFEYETDADDPLPGLMESIGYVRGVMRMM